ncbi:hypothetical protein GA0115256_11774 [Streptomyces sp. DconLS]|uniref:hypothetical protein n=1 Tax=Streptomyces sp. LamerLS-31b TaxID=1839765 RepID=UPI00081D83E8|nr:MULTISPECIES: hypothetical protein [unclassified Streptomyces]SCF78065.1 hypothetical protein GA0115256_11774 [Streptomyces sp. DconLS]SCG00682.1 hypothetical protein GA0115258_1237136 [Streptomyces sp. LamerLS-31b]
MNKDNGFPYDGANGDGDGDESADALLGAAADALLEEELRQAAAVLDPVPDFLRQLALEAYALHDLDARIAELTFDSLVDALPVRGVTDAPRMLTFRAGALTVDVEVTGEGLIGQVLPPGSARIEVLGGPGAARPVAVDSLGRFLSDDPPRGPFALRLRTGTEVIVTEWLRA